MNFREIKLGQEALAYMKDRLSCGNILANILLESRELGDGIIVTHLSVDIGDDTAKEFKTGGKLPPLFARTHGQSSLEPKADMDSVLVRQVSDFLNTSEENLSIFEDASAEKDYPFLSTLETRFSTYKNEVYHVLCHDDRDENKILETIRVARSWLFIGIMTSAPQDVGLCLDKKDFSLKDLKLLAERAEKIIVGAYDGEGYLTWSPSNQAAPSE